MHLHYASLIGLAAWSLIIPPMAGGKMDTAAPLAKWTEFGTFEDRQSCETVRNEMRNNPMTSFQLGQSRCVPSQSQPGTGTSPHNPNPK